MIDGIHEISINDSIAIREANPIAIAVATMWYVMSAPSGSAASRSMRLCSPPGTVTAAGIATGASLPGPSVPTETTRPTVVWRQKDASSVLTSITTGLTPGEHGLVGYRIDVGGDVLNVLRWHTDQSGDARRLHEPARMQPFAPFMGEPVPVVSA